MNRFGFDNNSELLIFTFKEKVMKKILILLLTMASTSAFADIGLFFDGTSRFIKSGVIQSRLPEVPLVPCRSFKSCDPYLPSNSFISIVYSDFDKMKVDLKKRARLIDSVTYIHSVKITGFKITVYDILAYDGRSFLMLGINNPKKKATAKQNAAIAQVLANEIDLAYFRAGL
jgi:hypothetical protein